MKKQMLLSIGVGALLAFGGCSQAKSSDEVQTEIGAKTIRFQVSHVDAQGASGLLTTKPNTVVIDIRTPGEIEEGYIAGAIFADFSEADFENQLSKLDRDASYIIHCKSGGRSTKALSTLNKLGFKNIIHMDGGLDDWKRAKLPLVTP